jgi:hypothetical protein
MGPTGGLDPDEPVETISEPTAIVRNTRVIDDDGSTIEVGQVVHQLPEMNDLRLRTGWGVSVGETSEKRPLVLITMKHL